MEDVLEAELGFLKYFKVSFTFLVHHLRNPEGKVVFETLRLNLRYALSTALLLAFMGTTLVMVVAQDEQSSIGTPAFIKAIKIVVTVRCLLLSVQKRRSLARFLNWILDLDRELYSHGCALSYRLIKAVLLLKFAIISMVVITSVVICASLTKDVDICALHVGVYNIPYMISSSVLLQFMFFTVSLWERIRIINCSVTNLILRGGFNHEPRCIPCVGGKPSPELLKKLGDLHSEICKGAKLINSTYSEQLLLTILRSTVEILNSIYSIMKSDNKMAIYYDGFWALMAVLELLAFILPCSSVKRQSRRTAQILNMLDVSGDDELKFERDLFLLQTMHQRIEFSASGFFALDETILLDVCNSKKKGRIWLKVNKHQQIKRGHAHSTYYMRDDFSLIVSTSVSYLIIQLQFEASP